MAGRVTDSHTADVTKTAIVGLGQMGRGIARNLDKQGFLIAGFDNRPEAFAEVRLSDRVANADPGQILESADVLVFAVPSTTEIEGFLAKGSVSAGQIVLDLTTSDPKHSRTLAEKLSARGVSYVDAAMTGGAAGADEATLTLMIGGTSEAVSVCKPILDAIASQTFHLGPTGSGQAMKLVHNLILHSSFLATCEGLRLAEKAGIDLDSAVAVLNAGNARSFVSETRFPRDILSGTMNARSRIANLEKDLGLAVDFAAENAAHAPFGQMTHRVLAEALATGYANTDFSFLFPLYDQLVARIGDDNDPA